MKVGSGFILRIGDKMFRMRCPKCDREIKIDHLSEAKTRCCPKCGVLAVLIHDPKPRPVPEEVIAPVVAEKPAVVEDDNKKLKSKET